LPDETRLDFPLTSLELGTTDFGVSNGAVTDLGVMADGTLLLQICQGSGLNRACGIGRWNGDATMLIPLQRGVVYGLPVASPFDGVLHLAMQENGPWSLYRLESTGLVLVPAVSFPGSTGGTAPRFTFSRKGDFLLINTPPSDLNLVSYGAGTTTAWGQGSQPLWFVAKGRPADATLVPTPPAVAYATPAATATPTVTPTVAAPLPMTMLITVKRNDKPVSGARVVAKVNGIECATAITGTGVTSMTFPGPGAQAACRQAGATIRFTVDDQDVAVPTATYLPQANLPFDLNLSN
jgi:hypothetical protein